MARILFISLPFPGVVHPNLSVAVRLAQRGHDVAYFTGQSICGRIADAGITPFPFSPELNAHYQRLVTSPTDGAGATWTQRRRLRAILRNFFSDTVSLQYRELDELLHRWPADLIVCDPAIWAPFLITTHTRQIPVVILSYLLGNNLSGPHTPQMGMGLTPGRNLLQNGFNRLAGQIMEWYMADVRRPAVEFRQQFGLPPVKGPIIQLGKHLPLFLVTSCPELDFDRPDLPGNTRYVGPLTWYPPHPPSTWLQNLPHDQPWVHATEGTIHYHESVVLKATAEALADQPATVILTTGGNREPAEAGLTGLAQNVEVVRWINHDELLPQIDLLVCTGGSGVMLAALTHGVPIIAAHTEWDHADNAERMAWTGAGISLPASKCRPERLRELIFEVLATPSYKENAQRIGSHLRQAGGPERAADLIEGVL